MKYVLQTVLIASSLLSCTAAPPVSTNPAPNPPAAPSPQPPASLPPPASPPAVSPPPASPPPGAPMDLPNTLQTVIDDMSLPHDAKMHGVPDSYSWSTGPEIGAGNDPKGFKAITAWGQLYEAATGNPASNSRVQLRDMKTFVLSKRDGRWREVQNQVRVEGAAYVEDFSGDRNKPADIRTEPSGGISVTAGGGYNFHFWPSGGRGTIDPGDIAGVFTTLRGRLVLNDDAKPDDRAKAKYLLGMGADYWLDQTAVWDNFKTNGGVGAGRMKFVKVAWQSFNMSTLSADELRKNPPPLE